MWQRRIRFDFDADHLLYLAPFLLLSLNQALTELYRFGLGGLSTPEERIVLDTHDDLILGRLRPIVPLRPSCLLCQVAFAPSKIVSQN